MEPQNPQNPQNDPETYPIIGAAIEVHRTLGPGFLEAVYQAALRRELAAQGVPARREAEIPVFYKGERLEVGYRADFICEPGIIVELKAQRSVGAVEDAQVLNYLRAAGLQKGLLLNFGEPYLRIRRYVNSELVSVGSAGSVV
jgi:GxxExxY protein